MRVSSIKMEFWAKSSQRQAKTSWNDYSTHYEILFTFQAILALLSCKFQGTQATIIITPSPSSLRSSSPSGAQNDKTTIYASLNRSETASSWTTTVIMSSSLFPPSTAGGKRTSTSLEYNKTVITSRIIALPTIMLSVTHTLTISSVSLRQSNPTTTPSVPTGLPTTVKGLPDVRIIAAIAAILGVILVVLSGIIVWSMCFAHTLERRRSSRVEPSEMGEINRSISQIL